MNGVSDMKKNLLLLFILFFSLLINSCASYVKVKVLKASEYDLGKIKAISVRDFTIDGSWNHLPGEQNLASQLANIAVKIFDNDTETTDKKDYNPKFIGDDLFSRIAGDDLFIVTRSGLNSESDVYISGHANYSINDNGEWYTSQTKKGNITINNQRYRVHRSYYLNILYQVFDSRTNKLILSFSDSEKESCIEDGKDIDNALSKLSDAKYNLSKMVEEINRRTARKISPYYVTEKREIKEGKSEIMKIALKYAKKSLWDDAVKSWNYVINHKVNYSQEDIYSAYYNLGIYYEIHEDFDKAIANFKNGYELSTKDEFLKPLERINERKKELRRLKSQVVL